MRRAFAIASLWAAVAGAAWGQDVIGDVLTGNLVKPKAGQWAWYELTDSATGERYLMRQAIVGSEEVKGKTGYWLEIEVIPSVGYKSVVKMLVTGPASDPKNVHRILSKQGTDAVEEIKVSESPAPSDKVTRVSLGKETVKTIAGEMEAEHVSVKSGTGGYEVWLNDAVRPMGIVRMTSGQGELVLRSFGEGGDDARSAFDETGPVEGTEHSETRVEVNVEEPKRNYNRASERAKGEKQ